MMKKIVTIHQVNYLPYIGFFNKVKQADILVMFDIADYVKNKFQNRNRIRTPDGWTYLTIPIGKEFYRKPFYQVMLPEDDKWMGKHWKNIQANYRGTAYFDSYKDFFADLYSIKHKILMELNEKIIRYLLNQFEIEVEIVKTTDLEIDNNLKGTDLLIDLLHKTNANCYLSGKSGKNYLEQEKFMKKDIDLRFHEFSHPIYKQRFDEFEPYMSAIDLLFNVGEKSKELI